MTRLEPLGYVLTHIVVVCVAVAAVKVGLAVLHDLVCFPGAGA